MLNVSDVTPEKLAAVSKALEEAGAEIKALQDRAESLAKENHRLFGELKGMNCVQVEPKVELITGSERDGGMMLYMRVHRPVADLTIRLGKAECLKLASLLWPVLNPKTSNDE